MCNTLEVGQLEIAATEEGDIVVRGHGNNRVILSDELREMCESDGPVTIR